MGALRPASRCVAVVECPMSGLLTLSTAPSVEVYELAMLMLSASACGLLAYAGAALVPDGDQEVDAAPLRCNQLWLRRLLWEAGLPVMLVISRAGPGNPTLQAVRRLSWARAGRFFPHAVPSGMRTAQMLGLLQLPLLNRKQMVSLPLLELRTKFCMCFGSTVPCLSMALRGLPLLSLPCPCLSRQSWHWAGAATGFGLACNSVSMSDRTAVISCSASSLGTTPESAKLPPRAK